MPLPSLSARRPLPLGMGRAPSPRCVLFAVCTVLYLPPLRTQHPVQSGRADPSGANVAHWGERRLSIPRLQAWGVSIKAVQAHKQNTLAILSSDGKGVLLVCWSGQQVHPLGTTVAG